MGAAAIWPGLSGAKQQAVEAGDAWPWQPPSEAAHITWEALQDLLAIAIRSVAGEIPERQRLVRAAAKSYDELQAKGTGTRALRQTRYGIRHCARCGRTFAAKNARHIWCTSTCRSLAHKARTAAVMEEAPGTSPAVA